MARGGNKQNGRGGRGGRGRGGRGGKSGGRFGERIMLNTADEGYAPPTATGSRTTRFRQVVTGTEEILSELPVQEKECVEVIKPKLKIIEEARIVSSSEDEGGEEDDSISQIQRVKHRTSYSSKKAKSQEENEYKLLWTQALANKQQKTKPTIPPTKDKVTVVHPIPRYQPAGHLNKFARKKIPLEEPKFDRVSERLQMSFAEKTSSEDPLGTLYCSRAAGEVWKNIFEMPHLFNELICLQLPNSLKALSNKDDFDDVRVGEQNILQAEDNDLNGQRKRKPRFHCMHNFDTEKPFGKIQMLKSGRVILRIGNRKFDICTMSKSFDPNVGVIIEFDDNEPKSATNHDNKIHSIGTIKHHFSAFYNYEEVFNAADEAVDGVFTARGKKPVDVS